jgi:arginine/lysine/histidine transport system permease protein
MLQLGLLYYSSKPLFGFNLSVSTAGILCFSLNSAAYVSEILKAGFNAIPKIQLDACKVLNISRFMAIKDILMPQAIKIVLPALINEVIDLVKESAVISTISGVDLMRRAYMVASQHHIYFEPFMVAGITYYIIVLTLTSISKMVEKCYR